MRKIYTVGEAIYDIIFENRKPVDAKVGGAMINTSVSLGRLGLPIHYIGDTANDVVGDIMVDFLIENHVDVSHFTRYDNSKSRLALAFVDDRNAPRYSFYKINTSQKIYLDFPKVKKDDIILFGSFYGIKVDVRGQLVDFLLEARKVGAILIYDPNFRPNHSSLLSAVMPYIEENIRFSDIAKGSNEDFDLIFGKDNFKDVVHRLKKVGMKRLIYTQNENGIDVHLPNQEFHREVKKLNPVSAVGAGDTFNAGLIYYLFHNNIGKEELNQMDENQWFDMLELADKFAANVCMSMDNYISLEMAESLK
ncbi:MAG: carbohydrate kinase [Bacteroidales bacterium]|nr:carbohydrate kinase [Bacteroidales bacterium]